MFIRYIRYKKYFVCRSNFFFHNWILFYPSVNELFKKLFLAKPDINNSQWAIPEIKCTPPKEGKIFPNFLLDFDIKIPKNFKPSLVKSLMSPG